MICLYHHWDNESAWSNGKTNKNREGVAETNGHVYLGTLQMASMELGYY